MTYRRRCLPSRAGFTLIELLAVIAIIALLMTIALPSLWHARMLARKAATGETLSAIGRGLSIFLNEFDRYPDSRARIDPITAWPDPDGGGPLQAPPDEAVLTGAHWLARVLVGHDLDGIDAGGDVLGDVAIPFLDIPTDRKQHYLDNLKIIVRDDDPRFKPSGSPMTGRPVVVDAFGYPILYYRANKLAKLPFGNGAAGGFVYNQRDNEQITGSATAAPWDFAGTRARHGIGDLVNGSDLHGPPDDGPGFRGKTFSDFLHSHSAHKVGGTYGIKPVNETKFILLSPGDDGLYGTDDDVSNF